LRISDYKALGGKLVRVRLSESNGIIAKVEITGDFFLVPEEDLPRLEAMLVGAKLDGPAVKTVVDDFFRKTHAEGLGVTRDDFVNAIVSSKSEGDEK